MTKNAKENTRYVRGGGSVRQRPDGRWEARCTINGKRRSFYGVKQADVLKEMRDAQAEAESKSYVEPSKMTFGEWLDIWYNEYNKPTLKSSTRRTREHKIERLIKPALGEVYLQSLDTTTIQRFYNKCLEDLSAGALKTSVHSVVMTALNQALKCGYITTNPSVGCKIPRQVKREFNPFTQREVVTFLNLLKSEKAVYRHLFTVLLFTGARIGEALGLSWDAIDFDKETITIKQQLQDFGSREKMYIETPKNGKARIIYPPAVVFDTLKAVRDRQEDSRAIAGEVIYDNPNDLVFTNDIGQPIASFNARYHFKRLVRMMGRPDMRIHDLRHTYAVMAFNAGESPKTVQNALGHHTAAFTLDVYTHVTEDMTRLSAARMQAYYEDLKTRE